MDTFFAKLRSDRKKHPTMKEYRFATYEECRNLCERVPVIDRFGNIGEVRITSIKTWKTRPDVEIRWKYGMYEYGIETVTPTNEQRFFVIEL